MILTEEELKNYVELKNVQGAEDYLINPHDGYVCHKKHKRKLGNIFNGYVKCTIGKTHYYNHRLNYIHHFGLIEANKEIDHKDKNRSNNNINNLRMVSIQENRKNRTPLPRREKETFAAQKIKALKYNNETKAYELFGEYDSMYKAAKACKVNGGAISQIIKNGYYKKTKSIDDNYFTFERI